MALYTLYLRSDENDELVRESKKQGLTPRELLKKRLENSAQNLGFRATESKLDALFLLIEMLAAEVGYTSGATRAASANLSKAVNEGSALEASFKKAAQTLRGRLEKQGAEVRL